MLYSRTFWIIEKYKLMFSYVIYNIISIIVLILLFWFSASYKLAIGKNIFFSKNREAASKHTNDTMSPHRNVSLMGCVLERRVKMAPTFGREWDGSPNHEKDARRQVTANTWPIAVRWSDLSLLTLSLTFVIMSGLTAPASIKHCLPCMLIKLSVILHLSLNCSYNYDANEKTWLIINGDICIGRCRCE